MRLEYDPDTNAAYVRLRHAAVTDTQEVAPGVLMDLAADGRPVGFEVLDASEVLDGRPEGVTFELVSRETSLTMRELDALATWLADRGYRIIGPGLDNEAEVHHTNIKGILRLYG